MEAVRPAPGATVLVVDDEAPVRLLAAKVLESRGYRVLLAGDSPDALHLADTYAFVIHLLLTDITLGSESGMALARAFLVKRPETAVLYMSGFNADTTQTAESEEVLAGAFLEKPFTPETLIDCVRAFVPLPEQNRMPIRPRTRELPAIPVSNEPQKPAARLESSEAAYRLESPVTCPHCGETVSTLKAVRLLRTEVNFTSTLPRRGRVLVCPVCDAIVPAELSNF
jgi:DNA-binding response OmpR family regulator